MALSSRPTIGVTRARQGRLGRNILWVLMIALLLVVLGFLAAYTWKARDLASTPQNNPAHRQAAANSFDAPPPAPSTRQNDKVHGPLAGPNPGFPAK